MGVIRARLEWDEFEEGSVAGVRRRVRAVRKGRIHNNGNPYADKLWKYDIEGALAERAVAKAFGLPWHETEQLDKARGDVGGFQVRSSDRLDASLILQPDDGDDDIFILVVHQLPEPVFTLCGWMLGSEGKLQRYWRDPGTGRPAFFIPQQDLNDMRFL